MKSGCFINLAHDNKFDAVSVRCLLASVAFNKRRQHLEEATGGGSNRERRQEGGEITGEGSQRERRQQREEAIGGGGNRGRKQQGEDT